MASRLDYLFLILRDIFISLSGKEVEKISNMNDLEESIKEFTNYNNEFKDNKSVEKI